MKVLQITLFIKKALKYFINTSLQTTLKLLCKITNQLRPVDRKFQRGVRRFASRGEMLLRHGVQGRLRSPEALGYFVQNRAIQQFPGTLLVRFHQHMDFNSHSLNETSTFTVLICFQTPTPVYGRATLSRAVCITPSYNVFPEIYLENHIKQHSHRSHMHNQLTLPHTAGEPSN